MDRPAASVGAASGRVSVWRRDSGVRHGFTVAKRIPATCMVVVRGLRPLSVRCERRATAHYFVEHHRRNLKGSAEFNRSSPRASASSASQPYICDTSLRTRVERLLELQVQVHDTQQVMQHGTIGDMYFFCQTHVSLVRLALLEHFTHPPTYCAIPASDPPPAPPVQFSYRIPQAEISRHGFFDPVDARLSSLPSKPSTYASNTCRRRRSARTSTTSSVCANYRSQAVDVAFPCSPLL